MPWLLNEDAALKIKLQGLTVTDKNNPDGLEVPVVYRLPETELLTATYPMIVIEIQNISFAADRQFSGRGKMDYAPEGYAPWWSPDADSYQAEDSPYRYEVAPTAYDIDYRVSVYSRLVRDHLLPLTGRLLQEDMLTARGAYLNIPQDGTFRHVTLMGGPKITYANVDAEDGTQKRFATSSFLIRVPTEIPNQITDISVGMYPRVSQILVDLSCYQDLRNINLQNIDETVGIISSGATLNWNTQASD